MAKQNNNVKKVATFLQLSTKTVRKAMKGDAKPHTNFQVQKAISRLEKGQNIFKKSEISVGKNMLKPTIISEIKPS